MTEYLEALSHLSPIVTGLLAGVSFLIGLFIVHGFIMWLFGINKLIDKFTAIEGQLLRLIEIQNKSYEAQRRLLVYAEVSSEKLSEIRGNTEQLLLIWEE